jgi:TolB-like protein/Tfp pilus assembly protein PilF
MARSPRQAVFLSYASEDSVAALRICEALRAAGVEVWFDQSELRGGEAWDRQIRNQIHDCALFIAVVSRHSSGRSEGYFRREWRLAVERTLDMADDAPFLLPVAVDETSEASARVPDRFRELQWMRLPAGAAPAALIERVRRLLSLVETVTQAAVAPAAALAPAASGPIRNSSRAGNLWRARSALQLIVAAAIVTGYLALEHVKPSAHGPTAHGALALESQTAASTLPAPAGKSIAVLPFVNMSSDKDQEYFSDGLSEELINLLAKVPELHVSARTSSFYFKGKQTLIADVAKALGVTNVLEGSVRKSGKTLRITAQLVRADNGYPIWSETYDRPLDDIFKIQDDIAGAVVSSLKVSLLGHQLPRATRAASTEAYSLYLQAESMNYFGASAQDFAHNRALLQQSLKLDSSFAPAWSSLARNLAVEYSLFGSISLAQAHTQGHAAVDQAIKADPRLAGAYVELGRVLYQVDWNWDAAATAIQKAILLEAGNAESYRIAAYIELTHGRFDRALASLDKAVSLDPLQAWNHIAKGYAAYRMGDLDNAERYYRRGLELNPASAKFHYVLGTLLLVRGRAPAALAEMQRETDSAFRQCGLVLAWDALGRKSQAEKALAVAERILGAKKAYLIALIYAARKDPDRAFLWLERALRQRDGELLFIKGEPLLESLVRDPRYQIFIQKMQQSR